ncbi:voltage-dependent chloride channel 1, chloroplastic-like [Hevea brasiliensis]|uniref:voltage-dependent chloride channel 1, chloroplastic-like n=1 Tax=Hevea brasiliensis TaxID=3981 RepID=UPI0025D9C3DA|nr:voltage-dependent chloride channel 1, chloroplastic-like [Hevea brasiliensis]
MTPSTTPFESPLPKFSLSSNFFSKIVLKLHLTTLLSKPPRPVLSFKTLCSHSSIPPDHSKTVTLIYLLRAIPDWADSVKEHGMQQKRSLYTHKKWVEHRRSLRHIRHLLCSLQSRVILSLIPPVIAFTSAAAVIAVYNSAVEMHLLPWLFPVLRASSLPYQLTAPALALLLDFRTEASYSRFEEGRKAWTECHVIYGSDIVRDLRNLLEVDDLAVVLSSRHRPPCIIEFISQCLQLLNLEESQKNQLVFSLSGVKDLMFAGRNWCLLTTHGNSHSTLIHPLDIKISGPLASHSSYNTLG